MSFQSECDDSRVGCLVYSCLDEPTGLQSERCSLGTFHDINPLIMKSILSILSFCSLIIDISLQ